MEELLILKKEKEKKGKKLKKRKKNASILKGKSRFIGVSFFPKGKRIHWSLLIMINVSLIFDEGYIDLALLSQRILSP